MILAVWCLLAAIHPAGLQAQQCADCTIALPQLDVPETIGPSTLLRYTITGLSGDCGQPATQPSWAVQGAAEIVGPSQGDTATVAAHGPFSLELSYFNTTTASPEACVLNRASNVRLNPNVKLDCGLNLIMVLDESNSINQSEENAVRDAVRSLLTSLEGSGSNVSFVEFGTRATAEVLAPCAMAGSPHFIPVNASTIAGCIEDYLIEDYGTTTSGGTNWDDAFLKVLDIIHEDELHPDLILFITDGNPTFYIDEGFNNILQGAGDFSRVSAVSDAMIQANKVKEVSRIFGIGIGTSVNASNLKLVSGIVPFGEDLQTADYMLAENFNNLSQHLLNLTNSLCGTSVSISQTAPTCVSATDPVVTLEITAENNGAQDATDVEIQEILPPGFQIEHTQRSPEVGTVQSIGNLHIWEPGVIPAGQSYTWTFTGRLPDGSGPFEAMSVIYSGNVVPGWDDTSSVVIRLGDLSLNAQWEDNSCQGVGDGSIDLTVTGGVPPYGYEWNNGNAGQDLGGLLSGLYQVEVTDAVGCTAVLEVEITAPASVSLQPEISVADELLCEGDFTTLTAPEGFASYQWFLNGAEIAGAVTSILEVGLPGSYQVYVSDPQICAGGVSLPVEILRQSSTAITDTVYWEWLLGADPILCLEEVWELEDGIVAWADIPYVSGSLQAEAVEDHSGVCLYLVEEEVAFLQDTVLVVACDQSRCQTCDTTVVVVARELEEPFVEGVDTGDCFIPNVLTPNGDGFNDYFIIDCQTDGRPITVSVYNRWGNQVYESAEYFNDWDGSYRGAPLPFGTYYYIVEFLSENGSLVRRTGDLTILGGG